MATTTNTSQVYKVYAYEVIQAIIRKARTKAKVLRPKASLYFHSIFYSLTPDSCAFIAVVFKLNGTTTGRETLQIDILESDVKRMIKAKKKLMSSQLLFDMKKGGD